MKVAIVTPGYLPVPATKGGAIEELITILLDQNEERHAFDFTLYTLSSNCTKEYKNTEVVQFDVGKYEEITAKIINKIYATANIEKEYNCYCKKLIKYLKKYKPKYDAILIENNMYTFLEIDKVYPNISMYLHLHNDIGDRDKPVAVTKKVVERAKGVIAVSRYIKRRVAETTAAHNIKVVNNVTKIPQQLESNNNKHEKVRFLYLGRFSKEKGLKELVQAYSEICKDYRNSELLIAGNDKQNNRYTRDIKKISNGNKQIHYLGQIEHDSVDETIKSCDVVIIPTLCNEAFGMSALEAIKNAIPVIATKGGGLEEIINEKYGIIINKENIVEEIKKSMRIMMDTKKRLSCKKSIIKNYNTLQIYNSNNYLKNIENVIKNS